MSHRGKDFMNIFNETKQTLSTLLYASPYFSIFYPINNPDVLPGMSLRTIPFCSCKLVELASSPLSL